MVRSDQITALAALVDDVCESDDLDAFTDRWGRAESSRARSDGVRVICGPDSPFDALEVRPWGADVTGVVDVEFRAGEPPLEWAAVRDRFGPFRDLPRLHGSGPQYGATTVAPGKAADAYLLVTVEGDVVVDLCVRRDPH
jgi:hypothetical protein